MLSVSISLFQHFTVWCLHHMNDSKPCLHHPVKWKLPSLLINWPQVTSSKFLFCPTNSPKIFYLLLYCMCKKSRKSACLRGWNQYWLPKQLLTNCFQLYTSLEAIGAKPEYKIKFGGFKQCLNSVSLYYLTYQMVSDIYEVKSVCLDQRSILKFTSNSLFYGSIKKRIS